jgi:hypothetical protein
MYYVCKVTFIKNRYSKLYIGVIKCTRRLCTPLTPSARNLVFEYLATNLSLTRAVAKATRAVQGAYSNRCVILPIMHARPIFQHHKSNFNPFFFEFGRYVSKCTLYTSHTDLCRDNPTSVQHIIMLLSKYSHFRIPNLSRPILELRIRKISYNAFIKWIAFIRLK